MSTPEDEDCIEEELHQKRTVLYEHTKPTGQRLGTPLWNTMAVRWILWQI